MNYIQIEMNEEIDIFNELPYKFQIGQIGKEEEKKGILIFKFEHVMTDGLGLISDINLNLGCAFAKSSYLYFERGILSSF